MRWQKGCGVSMANVDRGRQKHAWTGGKERKGGVSMENTDEGGCKHAQARNEQTGLSCLVLSSCC